MRLQQLLVNRLAEQLGEDTKKLSLRVGVHSGPVTGGILRGDRGRFQLFGDVSSNAFKERLWSLFGPTCVRFLP